MERCIFERDEIFNIIIVKESELANSLKNLNKMKQTTNEKLYNLNDEMLHDLSIKNSFEAWYFYTNERASL